MSRIERAKNIRDKLLRKAGLSFDASLALGGDVRTISDVAWKASISSVRESYASMPVAGAGRLDLWVHDQKVAVIAWTADELWTPLLKRGSWETIYFNQPRCRSPAERWVEVCSSPADRSILSLMQQAWPASAVWTDADPVHSGQGIAVL
jgi:hypothetical protein